MSAAADKAAPIIAAYLIKIIALLDGESNPAIVMTTLTGAVVYALDKYGITDAQFAATLAPMRRGRARAMKRGRSVPS